MLRDLLRQEGFTAGRKLFGRLMKTMGIEALYHHGPASRHLGTGLSLPVAWFAGYAG